MDGESRRLSIVGYQSSIVVKSTVENMGGFGFVAGDFVIRPFPVTDGEWFDLLAEACAQFSKPRRGLSMQNDSWYDWPKGELGVAPAKFYPAARGRVELWSVGGEWRVDVRRFVKRFEFDRRDEETDLVGWDVLPGVLRDGFSWFGFVPDRSVGLLERVVSKFAAVGAEGDVPVSFGSDTAWLALRHRDCAHVAEAVGWKAKQVVPMGWADGVAAAYEGGAFVTPPVDGWVFVLGAGVAELVDKFVSIDWAAAKMRKQFGGRVFYFFAQNTVDLNGWGFVQRDKPSDPDRCFAVLGESGEVWKDRGEWTDIEQELLDPDELFNVSEDDVFAVAAAWCVDPSVLDDRDDLAPGVGIWLDKLDFDFAR